MTRWLLLGLPLGVAVGLGGLLVRELLQVGGRLLLVDLAGYHLPHEGQGHRSGALAGFARPWALPLVVGLGGLLAGGLVQRFGRKDAAQGTDGAIDAFNDDPRAIRARGVVLELTASALTIGSGGSAGPEGPVTQIGAGVGSWLTRTLDLPTDDGRIAVAVGIGASIGTIFSAPLGGAVLCAELVYRDDAEYSALLPGLVASFVGYSIFGAVAGYRPILAFADHYRFGDPLQALWFVLLGALAGGLGILYAVSYHASGPLAALVPFPRLVRATIGGLLVGALALGLPEVLGTGDGWVQAGVDGALSHLPLLIVLALPLAKILATSLTLGSGGSGGVLTPALAVGGFGGLALWRLLEVLGASGIGSDAGVFILVGAMATLGGISRAPVASVLLIVELAGVGTLLVPAVAAVAVAVALSRASGQTLFSSQRRSRDEMTSARCHAGLPALAGERVGAVARPPRVLLQAGMRPSVGLRRLREAGVRAAPVVDEVGRLLGVLDAATLEVTPGSVEPSPVARPVGRRARSSQRRRRTTARTLRSGHEDAPGRAAKVGRGPRRRRDLGRLADSGEAALPADETLDRALGALTDSKRGWLVVTDADGRVSGTLSVSDVLRHAGGRIGGLLGSASRQEPPLT
ncbi:MAG: chloride channel protein [Actinomycetota bacterium]|nr:chloride channel protein [Actinomycetota bacterium]